LEILAGATKELEGVSPDAELVRRTTAGQRGAYGDLVRRWAGRVLAVCHSRVGRGDIAEELAQETLLRGMTALPTLRHPEHFGPWLLSIGRRVCLDWLDRARRRPDPPISSLRLNSTPEAHEPECEAPDEEQAQRSNTERLLREVEALPAPYRETLLLCYYAEMTYEQLADLMDVTPAAINARLTRARAMLRERLGDLEE
jgi:RNA polymerase sigma-70 factor (ECF subfamily)